jgi:hypothetical protein
VYNDSIQFHDDSANMRFIPVSQQELLEGLLASRHQSLAKGDKTNFQQFAELLQALYHSRYFEQYEVLKKYYQPFNPDQDVTSIAYLTDAAKADYQKKLFEQIKILLQQANYDELNEDLINEALSNEVSKNLSIDVEMEDFEQVLVFVRGHSVQETQKRHWRNLFLAKVPHRVSIYRRLCVVFRFRTEDALRRGLKENGMGRFAIWRHMLHYNKVVESEDAQHYVFMRLFRDVPRSDLQMLFPNSKLHFTLFDTLKLSVAGGAGALGGLWTMLAKLAIAVKPLAILIALAGFIGVISRNVGNVLNHRTNYKMVLSRSLYTHSLDINIGVMSALVDQAKDEDVKEALLAYYFLVRAGENGMTLAALDQMIERHLMMRYGVFIDFEIDDAVLKLQQDGLVNADKNGVFIAIPMQQACGSLIYKGNALFSIARRLASFSAKT